MELHRNQQYVFNTFFRTDNYSHITSERVPYALVTRSTRREPQKYVTTKYHTNCYNKSEQNKLNFMATGWSKCVNLIAGEQ